MGCLIVLVVLLLERIARWHNRPARWIWLVAITATVALPIALNLILRSTVVPHAAASFASPRSTARPSLDMPLLLLWLGGSLLLTARIAGSALALRRCRAKWVALDVGAERVLVSDQLGPAVIGWMKLTTVIPRWAFMLDERSRALMLQHESEHARAGDPHLRTFALAALVAMPWNPALWWSMRRLRLAVEIDCDRRLLARGVDARQYATLLLAVGERISATPFAWATALAGSPSSLETRILAMSSSLRPRNHRLAIGGITVLAAGLIAIACASPVPDSVVPPAGTVAKASTVTYDSIEPIMVVTRCVVGSLCPRGSEDMMAEGSIRRVADTVYYYRAVKANESSLGDLESTHLILSRLHDGWAAAKGQEQAVTASVNERPVTMKSDSVRVRP
jgi:beta-lactamase regulating signal transducer with metallopeptidase domain